MQSVKEISSLRARSKPYAFIRFENEEYEDEKSETQV